MNHILYTRKFHSNSIVFFYKNLSFHTFVGGLLSLLFFLSPACHSDGQNSIGQTATEKLPTRHDLRQAFRRNPTLTIVYPANPSYESFFKSRIARLNQNERMGLKVKGLKATELTKEQLSNEIILLIGGLDATPLLQEFSDLLPITIEEHSFIFDGKKYTEEAIFKLFPFPNPFNNALPFYFITGNEESQLISFLEKKYPEDWSRMFWSSWGYEVFKADELQVAGYLNDKTWQLDKKVHFDFIVKNDTILQTEHFQFITHSSPLNHQQVNEIAQKCEMTYTKVTDFLNFKEKLPKIAYHLYPSVENKGLLKNNMLEASVDFEQNRVEVVTNNNFMGSQLHHENKLLLRRILGKPKIMALEEGLSNYFTENWQKKGYRFWGNRLSQSGNLPSLSELLDNQFFERESPLVMGAMSGLFVDFLLQHFGKNDLVKKYAQWQAADLLSLEQDWLTFLTIQPKQPIPSISQIAKTNHKKSANNISYLKGFNFAHEGYRVYNGYGSQLAKASLERLNDIGTNSIAVVPYSFMRNPQIPSFIPIHHGAGGENDQAVLFAHFEAQRMGMHTMMKPQIWLGRSWPGDVAMKNEQDWQQFFENYYRWIRHYALLAEINKFDSFCLGVEFAKATLKRPNEWRILIKKIRGIYSGPITYAANWGDEFENLNFWDDLDFIGLNCYYPLSNKDNPSKYELKKAFGDVMEKAERVCKRYNKPLVFTEIGFRSVAGPWKNPHAGENGRPYDAEAQKRCYEVVFEGIKNKKWCAGILWWKWPSYLGYRGEQNEGFSPNDKPSEAVVERYFVGN